MTDNWFLCIRDYWAFFFLNIALTFLGKIVLILPKINKLSQKTQK
jgi:hypothetical protein